MHLRRTRFLWNARAFERLAIHNYDIEASRPRPADRLRRRLRRHLRSPRRRAACAAARCTRRCVERRRRHLSYTGLDDRRRETRLQFEPAPTRFRRSRHCSTSSSRPVTRKALLPRDPLRRRLWRPRRRRDARSSPAFALRAGRCAERRPAPPRSPLRTRSSTRRIRRSVSDLYMLVTETAHGPYPYAGIPWFSTFFGRDALITALADPLARPGDRPRRAAQACCLPSRPSRRPAADAEPGKILHEMRFGEMAELARCRSAATTAASIRRRSSSCSPAPISSAPATWRASARNSGRTSRRHSVGSMPMATATAMASSSTAGATPDGLINQGWKDSHDSVFHADGALARRSDRARRGTGLCLWRLAWRGRRSPAG